MGRTCVITEFQNMLLNKDWDEVLQQTDVKKGFNIYLNTFLRNFETCFPMQNVIRKTKQKKTISE